MPAVFFVVRATVADPAKRAAFDQWYQTEQLPDAVRSWGVKPMSGASAKPSCWRRRLEPERSMVAVARQRRRRQRCRTC